MRLLAHLGLLHSEADSLLLGRNRVSPLSAQGRKGSRGHSSLLGRGQQTRRQRNLMTTHGGAWSIGRRVPTRVSVCRRLINN